MDGSPTDSNSSTSTPREIVLDAVVRFVRQLRAEGVFVSTDAAILATEALAEFDSADRQHVRTALKTTLVTDRSDLETFDRLFQRFWRDVRVDERDIPEATSNAADDCAPTGSQWPEYGNGEEFRNTADESADEERDSTQFLPETRGETDPLATTIEHTRYSPTGRSKRVERQSEPQSDSLDASVERLTRALSTAGGRRRTRTTSGRFVDMRRALRTTVHTGGVVTELPESERPETDVRGVVLVDVSQSVLDYVDRAFLLEWLRLLAARWRSLRVFFFDTSVRDVTDAFDEQTVGGVTDALGRSETEWGGGTQIGHAFETIRHTAPSVVDRRTVVFVVSDGLERGDLAELERSTAWLARESALFLWLNPLATHPDYEPTARGMATALPAIDGLFAFSRAEDLAELARQLERHDRTRLGYQFDPRRITQDEAG